MDLEYLLVIFTLQFPILCWYQQLQDKYEKKIHNDLQSSSSFKFRYYNDCYPISCFLFIVLKVCIIEEMYSIVCSV